jgi:prolyl oligopeptidase
MRQFLATMAVTIMAGTLTAGDVSNAKPPATEKKPVTDRLHGVEFADPYRWLENADDPQVKEWVAKENAYTQSTLSKLPGRGEIRERLNALLDIGTVANPHIAKGHYFYLKREGKLNQPILYVRDGLNGNERVLVDPNTLAKDGTTALDWWYPSEDGKLVAYGLSQNGSEQSTLSVRDVATGKDLPDKIARTRYASVAWLPDGKSFYYTRYPAIGSVPKGEENYHHHVFFHQLGTDPAKDPKVFGEGRPAEEMPSVSLSPDGRWLVVTAATGWSKTEVYLRDLSQADGKFVPVIEKRKNLYSVVPRQNRLYIVTNESAPRYRVFVADPLNPARDDWREIIPEGTDVLTNIDVIGDTLVGLYMHRAASRLQLFDKEGMKTQELKLPTLGTVTGLGSEWDGNELIFGFQSFTMPSGLYHVDLTTRQLDMWQQIKTDIDFSAYDVEQVEFPSKDGTSITMFLAHKKGLERDGKNPTLLTAYGGFNISLTPTFNASRFLFLERGGLIAIPNLRGGGEYGEAWHKAGMLGSKQNVFDDYVSAAEWLIQRQYTSRDHLVIQGGSNGGLLTGAALTQRPDLFRAVVCQVPLLDMLRYHKFLIARLWIPEYGSADNAEQFKWLAAYSPYQHVKDGTPYPAVLLTAAESDSRVDALHARKMAARLQAATSSSQPILLRLETKAGHGAGKPRAKVLDEQTDIWSFVFWQLGTSPGETSGTHRP